jgi:IS30 family transposase
MVMLHFKVQSIQPYVWIILLQRAIAQFYFAHPNATWERGSNEYVNGLIRQYFTKKQSFENITDDEPELVMNLLNNRPRKLLDFKTPIEVFLEQPVALITLI